MGYMNTPVELSLDVSQFIDMNQFIDDRRLVIQRFNENTNTWEPVGGQYNRVLKMLSVNRLYLSKYTVMKSTMAFNDVDQSWAKDEINELLGKGVIDASDTFNAEADMRKDEFVSWVTNAKGLNDETATDADGVDPSNPYYQAVASAQKHGLLEGVDSDDMDGYLTNEDAAAILANALTQYDNKKRNENLQVKVEEYLNTGGIDEWSVDNIAFVSDLGIRRESQANLIQVL